MCDSVCDMGIRGEGFVLTDSFILTQTDHCILSEKIYQNIAAPLCRSSEGHGADLEICTNPFMFQGPGQVGLYELPTMISKSTQKYILVLY